MSVAFRAVGTQAGRGTGGNVSPGLPSGTAENDILICVVTTNDNATFPTMSGWTALESGVGGSGAGGTIGFALFWKRAGASESAPTVTYSGSAAILAVIIGYSGAGTATAIDVNGTTQVNANANATVTGPAVTTVAGNVLVVFAGGAANFPTHSSYSGTPTPTERFDSSRTVSDGPAIFIADFDFTTPGTTSNRTATLSAGCSRAGHLVALRQLVTGSTGLASETDSPLALTGKKSGSVGRSDERDTALALTGKKIASVALATEVNSALAVSGKKSANAGRADSTELSKPGPRFGFGGLDDSFYDNQSTYEAQLAGEPAYSLFYSVANIQQAKVDAWRAAWPGCKMLAYIDLLNMETSPASGSIYEELVANLTTDLWMRKQSDNSFVESLAPGRGYYFYDDSMMDVVTAWLNSPTVVAIMTRWDGVFIDNLDWTRAQGTWADEAAQSVKVNGVNQTAASLKVLYDAMSALITEKIHEAYPDKIVFPNASLSTTARPDPNINGGLSELTVSDQDVLRGSKQGWFGPPFYGSQWVRNMAQRDVVLAMTWDQEVVLFQFSGTGSAGVKGRMFYQHGAKIATVDVSTEIDTAISTTAKKSATAGLATTTETALALTGTKIHSVGLATETDSALALSGSNPGQVTPAIEVDTALALTGKKLGPIGLSSETDAALVLTLMKFAYVEIAVERDSVPTTNVFEAPPERTMRVQVKTRDMRVTVRSREMVA